MAAEQQMATGGKEWLPDEPRLIYVGNLAWSVKWQDLKDHMKQAGEVEFAKILTREGPDWGRSRGIGYVRYSTEEEAKNAVATLNNTELAGRTIVVDVWTGNKPRDFNGAFSFFPGKGGGKGFGRTVKVHGDFGQMVYVGNLPFKAEWQDLKDHMKGVGSVEFVKILTEDGTSWGRSKGIGCVRYSSAEEASQAVSMLNGSEMMGRALVVDLWSSKGGQGGDLSAPAA
jgi:RNA recognition motif-containing protein